MDNCKYVYNGVESEKLSDVITAIEGMKLAENTDGIVRKVYETGGVYDILYFEWVDGKPLWMSEGD